MDREDKERNKAGFCLSLCPSLSFVLLYVSPASSTLKETDFETASVWPHCRYKRMNQIWYSWISDMKFKMGMMVRRYEEWEWRWKIAYIITRISEIRAVHLVSSISQVPDSIRKRTFAEKTFPIYFLILLYVIVYILMCRSLYVCFGIYMCIFVLNVTWYCFSMHVCLWWSALCFDVCL